MWGEGVMDLKTVRKEQVDIHEERGGKKRLKQMYSCWLGAWDKIHLWLQPLPDRTQTCIQVYSSVPAPASSSTRMSHYANAKPRNPDITDNETDQEQNSL